MLTTIKKIQYLFKSEDQEIELSTPKGIVGTFRLMYKNIHIGTLTLNNGLWSFAYSPEFQSQDIISPIVGFPDKHKTYQSNLLFPFFASRIPSLQRLKLQKIIPPDFPEDEVALLEKFGRQSITNPYQLLYLQLSKWVVSNFFAAISLRLLLIRSWRVIQ